MNSYVIAHSLKIQHKVFSVHRSGSKPYTVEAIGNSAMRFKECGVLALEYCSYRAVLQNALCLWKEMRGLIFFGFNRNWRGLPWLPYWYFHMNTCGYLFKITPFHYPTTSPTILFISVNNDTNRCIHWNIQNKKVNAIKFLKLLKSCFEHSSRMEFEEQKERSF